MFPFPSCWFTGPQKRKQRFIAFGHLFFSPVQKALGLNRSGDCPETFQGFFLPLSVAIQTVDPYFFCDFFFRLTQFLSLRIGETCRMWKLHRFEITYYYLTDRCLKKHHSVKNILVLLLEAAKRDV